MRVLIVKTSSMGDLIHTLPAVSDAKKALPQLKFDWIAEEGFAEIPRWHRDVNETIVFGMRRWRKNLWSALKKGEIKAFLKKLRAQKYDVIIDPQALFKSAILSRLAKGGTRFGYDAKSVRSPFAQWGNDKTFFIDRKMHAITHIRELFAQTFNYSYVEQELDYGIDRSKFIATTIALPEKFVMFIPNASWTSKLWPEAYWEQLIKLTAAAGISILIPRGNADEEIRAQRLAKSAPEFVQVLPRMKLSELASIIAKANAAVFVDTGLGHLAAALNVPAVSLYGATDKALIGTLGPSQIHLSADFPCAPCKLRQCNYKKPSEQQPACFTTVPPQVVWTSLKRLVNINN